MGLETVSCDRPKPKPQNLVSPHRGRRLRASQLSEVIGTKTFVIATIGVVDPYVRTKPLAPM